MNSKKSKIKLNINLDNLKSDYFIQKFFNNINKKKSLEIIKNNKKLQKRLKVDLTDYKNYSELYSSIEIEIKPAIKKYGQFINIEKDNKKKILSYLF